MSLTFMEEEYVPVGMADEVAANVARIRDCEAGEIPTYLSESQLVMVGLALCIPDLLEKAGYKGRSRRAWARLDDIQRNAVLTWWKD